MNTGYSNGKPIELSARVIELYQLKNVIYKTAFDFPRPNMYIAFYVCVVGGDEDFKSY